MKIHNCIMKSISASKYGGLLLKKCVRCKYIIITIGNTHSLFLGYNLHAAHPTT